MGSSSPPQPPSPTASAQAQAQSQVAGTMFDIANAPIEGYANAYTSGMINPYTSALQTALANQGALSNAQAQRAIQSSVDPAAFNAREISLAGATNRLGRLYGYAPGSARYSAPGAFQAPSTNLLPDLTQLGLGAKAIAGQIRPVTIGNKGEVGLQGPKDDSAQVPLYYPQNYIYGRN